MKKVEAVTSEEPKKKPKRKRRRIYEVNDENDIKYRAPLSYRHLRIIGWVFLAVAQVGVILTLGTDIYSNPEMYGLWPEVLRLFSNLMSPLFLIAAFTTVIVAKDGYRRLITLYAGLVALMYALFLIVYQHYFIGIIKFIIPDGAQDIAASLFKVLKDDGFISFNFFIDLLLCTLVTFFINYNPTKFFQGKKIIIFRLFALLPIFYEIASIVVKMLSTFAIINLSPYLSPLLTTKPPLAFFIFVIMAIFMKVREKVFIKKGKTHEDYKAFLKTNTNALHFSIALSVTIFISAILDIILFSSLASMVISKSVCPPDMSEFDFIAMHLKEVSSWGFSQTVPMIFIIPIIMFFDYRKTYKDKLPDIIIPFVGLGLIAIVTIEGGFQVFKEFFAKLDIFGGGGEEEAMPKDFPNNILEITKRTITRFRK